VVATVTAPGDGTLGECAQALEIAGDGVILSALLMQDGRTVARLYEYRGEPGTASVALSAGATQLTEVNLLGEDLAPAQGPLAFGPWQIRTFRVDGA